MTMKVCELYLTLYDLDQAAALSPAEYGAALRALDTYRGVEIDEDQRPELELQRDRDSAFLYWPKLTA